MSEDIVVRGRNELSVLRKIVKEKPGFKQNGNAENTSLWYLPKSSAGPMTSLGEVVVKGSVSLDRIIDVITNLSTKGQWDPEYLRGCEISRRTIDSNTWVRTAWTASKGKSSVAGRDFVVNSLSHKMSENSWSMVSWSVEGSECPAEYLPKVPSPGHVRAKVFLAGFHAEKTNEGDWKISLANQVDIGISSWLADPVLMKNPAILNRIKVVLENS